MTTTANTASPVAGPVEPILGSNTVAVPSRRLLSIDALRGITIAFMIMVNNNGSDRAWWFMKHADWNGLTPTDLVFPTFLFLVGASIVLAFAARLAKGATRAQLAWQTVRRAIILFLFGIVVNGFPFFHLSTLRIYGVLQRIAICYLIVGLFYLWDRKWQSKVAVLIAALVGYWILMRWVPVPGYGMPFRDIPFLDKDAQWVAWLDRHLMPGRLYEGTRDPEGLISDIPALGTALLGLLAGMWIRSTHSLKQKAAGLAEGAALCLAIGYLWSIWFPLNKKLWTSSYVLVAGGIALSLLALLFWAVEVKGWRGKWLWAPLVLGSNAIAAYMISELLGTTLELLGNWINGAINHKPLDPTAWAYTHWFAHIPNGGVGAFAYSVSYLILCFIPVHILYRKKIFLKV